MTARVDRPLVAVLLVAAAALAGCGGRGHASFAVSPRTALLDAPVSLSLRGLDPDAMVTIRAIATDRAGVRWSSSATFRASGSGAASLRDASRGGGYTGSDPMGLLETMRPSSGSADTFLSPAAGYQVRLTASVGSSTVATTDVQRRTPRGVRTRTLSVARDGVHGTLFLPPVQGGSRPAVLAFGGSEGGEVQDADADLIAAHGFPVLSLAYVGEPGLPTSLTGVPLEYFARALRILAAQPGVDRTRMFAFGGSRGSEAALLVAVHYPSLAYGAIVGSPSDHASPSFPSGTQPAWTWHGRAVPTAPSGDFRRPRPADAPRSVFDVAVVRGPVMTICGDADLLWPSCRFADSIARARRDAGTAAADRYLRYPDAGHLVDTAFGYYSETRQPAAADGSDPGGDLAATLAGAGAAHQQLLALLRRQ